MDPNQLPQGLADSPAFAQPQQQMVMDPRAYAAPMQGAPSVQQNPTPENVASFMQKNAGITSPYQLSPEVTQKTYDEMIKLRKNRDDAQAAVAGEMYKSHPALALVGALFPHTLGPLTQAYSQRKVAKLQGAEAAINQQIEQHANDLKESSAATIANNKSQAEYTNALKSLQDSLAQQPNKIEALKALAAQRYGAAGKYATAADFQKYLMNPGGLIDARTANQTAGATLKNAQAGVVKPEALSKEAYRSILSTAAIKNAGSGKEKADAYTSAVNNQKNHFDALEEHSNNMTDVHRQRELDAAFKVANALQTQYDNEDDPKLQAKIKPQLDEQMGRLKKLQKAWKLPESPEGAVGLGKVVALVGAPGGKPGTTKLAQPPTAVKYSSAAPPPKSYIQGLIQRAKGGDQKAMLEANQLLQQLEGPSPQEEATTEEE